MFITKRKLEKLFTYSTKTTVRSCLRGTAYIQYLQARSRGRGRGARAPKKFSDLNLSLLQKWNFASKIDSCLWSIIVRLCTLVLLCSLELCKGTKSYFCSAKNNQQLWNRQKQNGSKCTNNNPWTWPLELDWLPKRSASVKYTILY